MDCSPPSSNVHEIFQARILEWVAISFPRGSSQPRGWTLVSCIAGRFFTNWDIGEVSKYLTFIQFLHNCRIQILFVSRLWARRHWNTSRDIKQSAKMSWSKHIEIIESVLLSLWNYVRNQYEEIFENNPPIFKCKWPLPRKIFDSAIQSLNKVKRLKRYRVWLPRRKHLNEKLISKWEINIKDT